MKSRLLLSASVIAVTVGLGAQAHAADETLAGTTVGDYVNTATIGDFFTDTGLFVTSSAVITGDIRNTSSGRIRGSEVGVNINNADLQGSMINLGDISAHGTDTSGGESPTAEADATGIRQYLSHSPSASGTIVNDGRIDVEATATASATSDYATASASATGINQYISSSAAAAAAHIDNSSHGLIDVKANATAHGGATSNNSAYASAEADANGIYQSANGSTSASASINNDGDILVDASAEAIGGAGVEDGYASASATATGIDQNVSSGGNGTATVINGNGGLIDVVAMAEAHGGANVGVTGTVSSITFRDGDAGAYASADASGVSQYVDADGNGLASATNGGTISVSANAQAFGGDSAIGDNADATAIAWAVGIDQSVYASGTGSDSATASVANSGNIEAVAKATAWGGDDADIDNDADASATAHAIAVRQYVNSDGPALATASNDSSGIISAEATAKAHSFDDFDASAEASAIGIRQYAESSAGAIANAQNDGLIHAKAVATADNLEEGGATASAYAQATGVYQEANSPQSVAALTNTGHIEAFATGTATADSAYVGRTTGDSFNVVDNGGGGIDLGRDVAFGVLQRSLNDASVNFTVDNSGSILADAYGEANGDNYAQANVGAVGVAQSIEGENVDDLVLNGIATVLNSAAGEIRANASAYADGDTSDAYATANAIGVFQFVQANDATALVSNDGDIFASAYASVEADSSGSAEARAIGVSQNAVAADPTTSIATVNNTGNIYADASAYADGNDSASATASATGINQFAANINGDAFATVTNSGHVQAVANANAGFGDPADINRAHAEASGVYQEVTGGTSVDAISPVATILLTNSSDGVIDATAHAIAYGYGSTSSAFADATATGVEQQLNGVTGVASSATVTNLGDISASAVAEVQSYGYGASGSASALAFGVLQDPEGDPADFSFGLDNAGDITAFARAHGDAVNLIGIEDVAKAVGVEVGDSTAGAYELNIDHVNQLAGLISASAEATSSASSGPDADASAVAMGMEYHAGRLNGTVENLGEIRAIANADADGGEFARAVGINLLADANNLTVTNEGEIYAYAHIPDGEGSTNATGIFAASFFTGTGPYVATFTSTASLTIANDGGTIFAGIGGVDPDSVLRGNAINIASLTDTDQGVVINLMGSARDGNVYGDILLPDRGSDAEDQVAINVTDGRTRFNGVIQSGGIGFDAEDSSTYRGDLNIYDDGILHLALNQDPATPTEYRFGGLTDGQQPRVYIQTLNVESDGILSIGLSPDSDPGHYGQVFANSIDLVTGDIAGRLKGHFIPAYYAANFSATYTAVVNSPTLTGGVTFADEFSNTPLIDVVGDYTTVGRVDLVATRNSFEDAANSANRKSVGAAIDSFYGDLTDTDWDGMEGLHGGLDQLIASIFALDGDQAYQDKLDELSGAPYAQQLNQVLTSFGPLQNVLFDRLNGGANGGGALGYADEKTASTSPASNAILTTGSVPAPSTASIWARGFGTWGSQSDPSAALAYNSNQTGAYVGGDVNVTPDLTLGLAGGFVGTNLNFRDSDKITYSGYQVAGYGRLDAGQIYIRGFGGYGGYNNTSTRFIDVMGSIETATGSYASRVGTVYGEVGFTGWQQHTMGITPFAGLGYTAGSNDAFTETGSSGNLDVAAATGSTLASSLGAQWSMRSVLGSMPFEATVRAAWEHRWTGDVQAVGAAFDNAPSGSGFVSSAYGVNDLGAISVAGTLVMAPMTTLTVQYDGRFGSGFTESTASAAIRQKF